VGELRHRGDGCQDLAATARVKAVAHEFETHSRSHALDKRQIRALQEVDGRRRLVVGTP
jgi:hypothetical protein